MEDRSGAIEVVEVGVGTVAVGTVVAVVGIDPCTVDGLNTGRVVDGPPAVDGVAAPGPGSGPAVDVDPVDADPADG